MRGLLSHIPRKLDCIAESFVPSYVYFGLSTAKRLYLVNNTLRSQIQSLAANHHTVSRAESPSSLGIKTEIVLAFIKI